MQLVVQSGAEPGRTYDVSPSQEFVIGRQSGNDVVVPDEQVSRKHAKVEQRNGTLVVTDLNSSNGTFVNGTRISSPQNLKSGDTLQVGTTVLRVVDNQTGAATQPAPTNYRQAAQDAGFAQPAQAQAQPASDYGQQQPVAPAGYGAPDPNYNPAQPYGQAPANYGGQAGGYDPANYGGQAGGYGQQAPSYGGQVGTSAPAKAGLPVLPLAIGGVVILLIIIVLLFLVLAPH